MFALPRRAIFQQTRSRTTKYWQSVRIRNQSSIRSPVPVGTWTKHLHLLQALGPPAELLAITLSKVCKQSYHAYKRRWRDERQLKNCWDSSDSTKLRAGNGCGAAPRSLQELFCIFWQALKQPRGHGCSVINQQTFKLIQRMSLCLFYMAEVIIQNPAGFVLSVSSIRESKIDHKHKFFNLKIKSTNSPTQALS